MNGGAMNMNAKLTDEDWKIITKKEKLPVVTEASNIDDILKDRGKKYGKFKDHARITQELKTIMHNCPKWPYLEPDQHEALEMIQHKIGRILNGDPNYADSWDDIAGYAKLVGDRLNGKIT